MRPANRGGAVAPNCTIIASVYLYSDFQGSDKVYNILVESGYISGRETYTVYAEYGARGASLNNPVSKYEGVIRAVASETFNKLMDEKIKKGYRQDKFKNPGAYLHFQSPAKVVNPTKAKPVKKTTTSIIFTAEVLQKSHYF